MTKRRIKYLCRIKKDKYQRSENAIKRRPTRRVRIVLRRSDTDFTTNHDDLNDDYEPNQIVNNTINTTQGTQSRRSNSVYQNETADFQQQGLEEIEFALDTFGSNLQTHNIDKLRDKKTSSSINNYSNQETTTTK
eukprot:TRINITY_DN701_c0_g1_i1.p1 TRINITY_DN701_c0_g1~~TRINITY_DN701_c0_g1_i1.p1  ORF type:complete len:135 (+),score=28.50 TRINITY_DN701_c0_g1_i1:189-593(+)